MSEQQLQDTPVEDVATIVQRTADKASEWKSVSVNEKIGLLERVLQNSVELRQEWLAVGAEARHIDASQKQTQGWAMAEVEICGPVLLGSYCNTLLKTLKAVARTGLAPSPSQQRAVGDHHTAVTVYPDGSLLELTETVGMRGELLLKKDGDNNNNNNDKQSTKLQATYESYAVGGAAGILGAGNYDFPADILTELFIKGRTAVYKPNPVVQKSAPVLQHIFAPLIERGFLKFVIGGAAVGSALVQQSVLDEIVLTGSVHTFEKIQPLAGSTPICAELGAVNPWIIVPGPKWNKGSINAHARALAFAKLVNNGHVCAAPQAILVAKDWKWRSAFMERLRYWLAQHPGSPAFYPGSDESHAHFAQLDGAEQVVPEQQKQQAKRGGPEAPLQRRPSLFGQKSQHSIILFTDLDGSSPSAKEGAKLPRNSNLEVLTREAFCPVLAEVALDYSESQDPVEFLRKAVHYAETKLFGSLTATLLMDDKTARRPEVDQIIADMKFGVVGVNVYPTFCYSLPQMIWGAFPGQTESGEGFLGNCGMYDNVEKGVLRAPFFWIGRRLLSVEPSAARSQKVFRRMAQYKMKPNLLNQTKLFSALFLGV